MKSLKNLYNVRINLKGIAKQGHCRPTIAEMWDSSTDYDYLWCSAQPILDNFDQIIYDNADNVVLM